MIWGAGCYGKNLVKYIETKDVKIQSIVDSDQKKHGSKVGEYEIKCVKAVDFNHIDIVIVAAKGVYSEVEEQLRHYNIHVIDLLTYLEYGNRAV